MLPALVFFLSTTAHALESLPGGNLPHLLVPDGLLGGMQVMIAQREDHCHTRKADDVAPVDGPAIKLVLPQDLVLLQEGRKERGGKRQVKASITAAKGAPSSALLAAAATSWVAFIRASDHKGLPFPSMGVRSFSKPPICSQMLRLLRPLAAAALSHLNPVVLLDLHVGKLGTSKPPLPCRHGRAGLLNQAHCSPLENAHFAQ